MPDGVRILRTISVTEYMQRLCQGCLAAVFTFLGPLEPSLGGVRLGRRSPTTQRCPKWVLGSAIAVQTSRAAIARRAA